MRVNNMAEPTIQKKAWELYFKMRFDRTKQKDLQQPEQGGEEA